MANNIENYQPNVPKEIRERYKKAKMRNFIGYLVCQWVHHSNYRSLNNGWFFIPSDKMVKETGLSKHTILNYESQLILEGMIEKKSGNFTDRKANEYRCTFMETAPINQTKTAPIENCTETKTSTKKTAPINCTEDSIENEELNEKTAPIENEENCTTDTVTVPEQNIYYKTSIGLKSIDTGENSNVMERTEEKTEKVKERTGLKSDSTVLNAFKWDKLLSEYVERRELLPYEQRKAAREWYNKAWKRFMSAITNRNLSWREIPKHFKSFMEWLVVITNNKETYKEYRQTYVEEYSKKSLDAFFEDYGDFIDEVKTDYLNDTKRYSKKYKSYRNLLQDIINGANTLPNETREKTLFKVEAMYNEVIEPQLKKLQSKYKPEELDPDLMYQNLAEQETSLPMEEKEELPFTTTKTAYDEKQPSESVSDTFNKAYNVWKKLQRECLNKGKRISPEEIGNFLNWAEKLEGFTNYDMEVMRNLIQET